MKSSASLKFIGDGYEGFYTAGLTMISNDSIKKFTHVSSDDDNTVLSTDDGLRLSVTHVRDKESDATNVVTSFKNDGKEAVTLEMMTSFLFTGIKADKVHRIRSFWSEEGRLKTDVLADLNLERAWNNMAYRVEKFGTVGTMPVRSYFPFVALEDSESGTFTGVLLCSPASWQIEIIIREDDTYTLAGGIADRDFGHWSKEIKPGEEFIAPRAIAATGNSLLDVCDKLVKAQHPDISPVDDHMGIVFNEYCTTWGHPSYDNLKKMADKLEGKGIQYLVMDSGWYGATDSNWWESTGDWEVNEEIFPGGLKPICDYIRSKGMIPGIWFEYETVGYKSRLFNDAEHLLNKDGHVLTVGNRRFLDLEDPWVKDFLDKHVTGLLKDSGYENKNGRNQLEEIFAVFYKLYQNEPDFFRYIYFFDAYVVCQKISAERLSPYQTVSESVQEIIESAIHKGLEDGSISSVYRNCEKQLYYSLMHTLFSTSQKLSLSSNMLKMDKENDAVQQLKLLGEILSGGLK